MIKRLLIILFMCITLPCFAQRDLTTNEAVVITVDLVIDETDGVTPRGSLDVTDMTVELIREYDDGSVPTRVAFSPTASGGGNDMVLITSSTTGTYGLELTAGQLNFTGYLIVIIIDTDAMLPWRRPFRVTAANVVDAGYGTVAQNVNVASEDNIDFGALKKTSLNAATTDLSAITGDKSSYKAGAGDVAGAVVDMTKIHGSALSETTGGYLAAAFVKLFDVATPVLVASDVMRGTDSAALASAYTATRAGYIDDILQDTAVIGALGVGLTAITDKTGNLPTDPADASVVASLIATAQSDLDKLTGTDGATLATTQANYAPAKAGDSMGLSNDAITAAKVHVNAWQELIELLFDYDATADYASAHAGSLVKQIGSNATVTIPPRIE